MIAYGAGPYGDGAYGPHPDPPLFGYGTGLYGGGTYGGLQGDPIFNTLPIDAADALTVNVGATNDAHTGRADSNVLAVKNTTGYAGDVLVRSISYRAGGTSFDPDLVIRYGVPIPYVTAVWDPAADYNRDDLVVYRGRAWRALRESLGAAPPIATDADDVWEALGLDRRTRMSLSAYAHGPLTGTPGSGGVAVEPYVALFDAHGNLLNELSGTATAPAIYDAFTTRRASDYWASRVTDIGAKTWEILSGTGWTLGTDPEVGYANPTPSGVTVVDSGLSNCRIAVTLVVGQRAPHGLVFRVVAADDYWSVSRTALQHNTPSVGVEPLLVPFADGGALMVDPDDYWTATPTGPATAPSAQMYGDGPYGAGPYGGVLIATFPTPFADGDRMMVDLNGPRITVYRNGIQVLQISSTINQSATRHGMFA